MPHRTYETRWHVDADGRLCTGHIGRDGAWKDLRPAVYNHLLRPPLRADGGRLQELPSGDAWSSLRDRPPGLAMLRTARGVPFPAERPRFLDGAIVGPARVGDRGEDRYPVALRYAIAAPDGGGTRVGVVATEAIDETAPAVLARQEEHDRELAAEARAFEALQRRALADLPGVVEALPRAERRRVRRWVALGRGDNGAMILLVGERLREHRGWEGMYFPREIVARALGVPPGRDAMALPHPWHAQLDE